MSVFITLSCPTCGGKLAPSRAANTVVCLHCGIEHYAPNLPVEDVRPRLHGTVSLGLPSGMAVALIGRETPLPTEVSHSFSTARDNQPSLDLTLVFGEQSLTQDNVLIGTFVFDQLTPAPRGVPEIDIGLRVDEHKHLTVTATEVSTRRTEVIGRADLSGLIASPS